MTPCEESFDDVKFPNFLDIALRRMSVRIDVTLNEVSVRIFVQNKFKAISRRMSKLVIFGHGRISVRIDMALHGISVRTDLALRGISRKFS